MGEQRGGQLDEVAAAFQDGRRKAGEVADDAAAEGKNVVAALDAQAQQPIDRGGEFGPAFGGFAGGEDAPCRLFAGGAQGGFDGGPPQAVDLRVGDDGDDGFAQGGAALDGDIGQQSAADADLIGAASDINRNGDHGVSVLLAASCASSQPMMPVSMVVSVRVWGPLSLVTWMGARA